MEQPSFASLEFQNKKRKTRREAFLERDGRPDSLGAVGGADPAPITPKRVEDASLTTCR